MTEAFAANLLGETLLAMSGSDVELVRRTWEAFARGDIEAAASRLDRHVRSYGAGKPDAAGCCNKREAAAAFLRRALDDGLTAELLEVRDAGARLVAVIHTHAPPECEQDPQPHGELVTVCDSKITHVVVYPTVGEALSAGGLPPDT